MSQEKSQFENDYLAKVNTFAFFILALHLPVLCGIALFRGASPVLAAEVMLVLLAGPAAMLWKDRSSELGAVAVGIAAMGVSALAIHTCNGMIEAHFELFVLIALLTVYGRIAPLLAAGATIALHHVIFWLWLPASVFNYKASFSIVLVHAFFVVMEVIPACWIARQFGRSIRSQGIVMESLAGAAEQIAAATREVATSGQALAEGASEQAAAIEETSASAAEIHAMAKQNTANSSAMASLTAEAEERSHAIDESLAGMVDAMNGIASSGEQISRIIRVIEQIAFQTNILALNAAVEAARAGEAGSGFAIVADEVRSLAHRSTEAAKDSAELIADSKAKSEVGKMRVDQVAAAMRTISADSVQVKRLVDEISMGSEQQSRGIEQVSRAIQQMEKVTQANAASAEETAAAASELQAQSDFIRSLVDELKNLK